MSRKRFSERDVIEALAWQGHYVDCFRCSDHLCVTDGEKAFWYGGDIEREHVHEIALGGPDSPANCRYSHKACHAIVTNGTKATSAGSSKQRIAKVKRLIAGPKQPKGRPLKSRGFQKHLSKRMDGSVVPR